MSRRFEDYENQMSYRKIEPIPEAKLKPVKPVRKKGFNSQDRNIGKKTQNFKSDMRSSAKRAQKGNPGSMPIR